MSDREPAGEAERSVDLGEYCRRVEEHLARVNEGHLIRIAGTAFEVVRAWARDGIPLAIVFRGIDEKAERHRTGRSKRPLRLEFCEGDVRARYDDWRRAVGVMPPAELLGETTPALEERRRPSLARQVDRAIDRVTRAAGHLEASDAVRDALGAIVDDLAAVRADGRGARGDARREIEGRLVTIDAAIGAAARAAAGERIIEFEADAAAELAAFRTRLTPAAWQRSLDAAVDRLLRERYGLPTIETTFETS